MTRALIYSTVIVVATLIQSSWLARLPVWGAVIDPLLPLVVAVGIFRGAESGAVIGLGAGLLQDLVSGAAIGVNGLSKLIVGFASGQFERSISVEDPFLPAVATCLATLLGQLLVLGVLVVTDLAAPAWPAMIQTIVAQAVLNSAIAPLIFRGVRMIEHQVQKRYQGN